MDSENESYSPTEDSADEEVDFADFVLRADPELGPGPTGVPSGIPLPMEEFVQRNIIPALQNEYRLDVMGSATLHSSSSSITADIDGVRILSLQGALKVVAVRYVTLVLDQGCPTALGMRASVDNLSSHGTDLDHYIAVPSSSSRVTTATSCGFLVPTPILVIQLQLL